MPPSSTLLLNVDSAAAWFYRELREAAVEIATLKQQLAAAQEEARQWREATIANERQSRFPNTNATHDTALVAKEAAGAPNAASQVPSALPDMIAHHAEQWAADTASFGERLADVVATMEAQTPGVTSRLATSLCATLAADATHACTHPGEVTVLQQRLAATVRTNANLRRSLAAAVLLEYVSHKVWDQPIYELMAGGEALAALADSFPAIEELLVELQGLMGDMLAAQARQLVDAAAADGEVAGEQGEDEAAASASGKPRLRSQLLTRARLLAEDFAGLLDATVDPQNAGKHHPPQLDLLLLEAMRLKLTLTSVAPGLRVVVSRPLVQLPHNTAQWSAGGACVSPVVDSEVVLHPNLLAKLGYFGWGGSSNAALPVRLLCTVTPGVCFGKQPGQGKDDADELVLVPEHVIAVRVQA